MKWMLPLLFLSTAAFADEPKTVTLTQAELQALIQSESAKAVANYVNNEAKGSYDKIREAFSPPPPKPEAKPDTPLPPPRPADK